MLEPHQAAVLDIVKELRALGSEAKEVAKRGGSLHEHLKNDVKVKFLLNRKT